jgi:hypothetical protein
MTGVEQLQIKATEALEESIYDDHSSRITAQDTREDLDFESMYLFISMRRAVFHWPQKLPTFHDFVRKYDKKWEATRWVFVWLGLAVSDHSAPLKWRPTIECVYVLAEVPRESWEETECNEEDVEFMEELQRLALGRPPAKLTVQFIGRQLTQLGLAETVGDWYFKPTDTLKDLVRKAKQRHSVEV